MNVELNVLIVLVIIKIFIQYIRKFKYMKNWSFDVTDNDTSSYDKY